MLKHLRILFLLLPLTGCYSPQQIEAARQAQIDADNQTCASYGFPLGTEAFSNCRMQLDLTRQQAYYYNNYYQPPVFVGGYYYRR
jgi:hypothetical protein